MAVVYNRTSAQVPSPIGPSSYAVGAGASGPYAAGMVSGVAQKLNIANAIEVLLGEVGAHGYGVVSGCDISSPSGLTVAVSAGIAVMDALISTVTWPMLELIASGTPFGPQVLVSTTTLADNTDNYVWLTNAGALAATTVVGTPPTGARVFLATVTTAGGVVTVIDYSGRITITGGDHRRITADAWAPTDTPASTVRFTTQTSGGTYYWDGVSHKPYYQQVAHAPYPWVSASLVADKTLTAYDPNVQWLVASGSDRTVKLPANSQAVPGAWFLIYNAGDATVGAQNHNVVVKDSTGAVTICTLTPGKGASINPIPPTGGGTITWPSSVTPFTPPH